MQEAFPEYDWSLTTIMKNAMNENIKKDVLEELAASEARDKDTMYDYPTLKEMDMYRKYLITSYVINYGVVAEEDINMFNENGLIRGICTRLDGTYPLKSGTFDLKQIIEIRKDANHPKYGNLFEEDIFAEFIEADYCGVV